MKTLKLTTESSGATIEWAKKLSSKLRPGSIVCLHGDLGAGKTTLVQGIAMGKKIRREDVHSPTFVLMNYYKAKTPVYHFDLYRLENLDEIHGIGYEEFFYGEGVAVVEWADKLKNLYPQECLKISLSHAGETRRDIVCEALGKDYEKVLHQLNK